MSRKITAIIRKPTLDEVLRALRTIGIRDIVVTNSGVGESRLDFRPTEAGVESAVRAMKAVADPASRFDGIIMVYPDGSDAGKLHGFSPSDTLLRTSKAEERKVLVGGE